MKFILSNFIENVLSSEEYEKLEDGSYAGNIPSCKGVVPFGNTLNGCENGLRSTVEEWIYLRLRPGHCLPVLNGINMNRKIKRESEESM